MGRVILAPIGENLDSIYAAVKAFPTDKVFLLSTGKHPEKVGQLKKVLDNFRIPSSSG